MGLIHFNICLIWLISCNAENACYEACVFEMLVALWRVDWVLVVTCDKPHWAVEAGCRMPKVDDHLCLLNECDLMILILVDLWYKQDAELEVFCLLLLSAAVDAKRAWDIVVAHFCCCISFGECWVDPTLTSWVLLDNMWQWTLQGSYFSIQPKSKLNWFEGRVCDPMKDVLRAKH